MEKKILVTYRIPEQSLEELEKEGYTLCWPEKERMTREEIMAAADTCVAVISVFGVPFPDEAMDKNHTLKIISNYGAGVDNLNLEGATKAGIVVTNTPDEVTAPTAELAVGMMLALARRISEMDRNLRIPGKIQWGVMENLGISLQGKTLGILGLGRIGKAMAQRSLALGMQILYNNRKRLEPAEEQKYGASFVSFTELLETADVLSVHTPLTAETFHIINDSALEKMKNSAFLINTARGPVADEQALIKALKHKKIAGAGLDVFEKEPVIPEPLRQMDNVILAPHVGTATWETRVAIGKRAALNILEYFRGKPPRYCVNPEVLQR